MPNKDINKSNDIYNFYEHAEVKKLIKKVHNPCKEVHQLDLPFRVLICGASGSGKTSILLNLISKCQDTFGKIYIVCKAQEPLYEYLEKNLNTKGKKKVIICTKLSELPSIHKFPDRESFLMIT
jgi:ABC-type lipoprotein export system ATPase subunit